MKTLDYEWESYTDLEEIFDKIMRSGTIPDPEEEFEDGEYFEDEEE